MTFSDKGVWKYPHHPHHRHRAKMPANPWKMSFCILPCQDLFTFPFICRFPAARRLPWPCAAPKSHAAYGGP